MSIYSYFRMQHRMLQHFLNFTAICSMSIYSYFNLFHRLFCLFFLIFSFEFWNFINLYGRLFWGLGGVSYEKIYSTKEDFGHKSVTWLQKEAQISSIEYTSYDTRACRLLRMSKRLTNLQEMIHHIRAVKSDATIWWPPLRKA